MVRFRTKRQKRELLLSELTPERWRADHKVLFVNVMIFMSQACDTTGQPLRLSGDELITKTNDPEWRRKAINILLDHAEEDDAYAKRLDRYLGLPTDAEDKEYQVWWTVKRNQIIVLSLIVSIVALWALLK